MNRKTLGSILPSLMIILMAVLACTVGQPAPGSQPPATLPPPTPSVAVEISPAVVEEEPTIVPFTLTPPVAHKVQPAELAVLGRTVYDVESEGKLKIYDKGVYKRGTAFGEFQLKVHSGDIYIPRIDMTEPLKNECSHFVGCVREHKQPLTGAEDGLRVVRVLEAAQRSLDDPRARRPIRWPCGRHSGAGRGPRHSLQLPGRQRRILRRPGPNAQLQEAGRAPAASRPCR